MAKKRIKKKISRKVNERRIRAKAAAIRRIMEEDGITEKQALKRYQNAIVEVIVKRPTMSVARDFLEVSPGKWREIPPEYTAYDENAAKHAIGPTRSYGYLGKVRRARQYWELVYLLSDEMDLSVKETRKKLKKRIEDGSSINEVIYETAKEEFQAMAKASKRDREKYLGTSARNTATSFVRSRTTNY